MNSGLHNIPICSIITCLCYIVKHYLLLVPFKFLQNPFPVFFQTLTELIILLPAGRSVVVHAFIIDHAELIDLELRIETYHQITALLRYVNLFTLIRCEAYYQDAIFINLFGKAKEALPLTLTIFGILFVVL